jgi:hypothetical protein
MSETTVIFKKGSSKPWKIMQGSKVMGAAMTRKQAEDMSKGMVKYPKSKGTGIDAIMDDAIESAPAPIKGKLATAAGKKKPYTPARGRMEGEPAVVDADMYEEEDEEE